MANPYNKGIHIGIKKFSNWLTEMQLKLINKEWKQSISEKVKRRKFLNNLPHYIEATLIPQVKEDRMHKHLVQQVESYEASKQQIVIPSTTTTGTPRQTSTKLHNPDCNRLRNRQQQQKTAFNLSNNNPGNQLAKSNVSNNPDLDTIIRNLKQKTNMKLIRDKKCLWYCNKGHNYQHCRK